MLTRQRKYLLIAVPLTMSALVLSACSSDSTSADSTSSVQNGTVASASPSASSTATVGSSSLAGSSWQLKSFVSSSGATKKATTAPSAATLVFAAEGQLSGSTGCNSFNGTYSESGSALKITVGPMTLKACSGAAAAQETAVLKNLAAVDSFAAPVRLRLKNVGKTVLTYKADASGLAGSSWVASGINNGKGAVATDANTAKVTAKFSALGVISGSGGCNTYTASYATSGQSGLTIGPAASTMMACETAVMTTEQQYFAALGKVAKYQRDGNKLTLRDAAGATQVTYIPAP